jgi:hypothetical protein
MYNNKEYASGERKFLYSLWWDYALLGDKMTSLAQDTRQMLPRSIPIAIALLIARVCLNVLYFSSFYASKFSTAYQSDNP